MKRWVSFCAAAVLTACGTTPENDPIYQALRANPPTSIPDQHLAKLRQGRLSCDVFHEGRSDQYMTCWWPQSFKPTRTAYLTYYGSSIVRPPTPSIISVPGGDLVTENVAVK
jgi:hypothetical protein